MKNILILQKHFSSGKKLQLIQGDITEEHVDVIVNAANTHLKHGGGVAGAIVRKGGQIIQQESDRMGAVPVGGAALTSAGKLPAQYIIHAVGPRWGEGNEDQKLENAVLSSLELAAEKGFQSISLPAISSGIFGFPQMRCARILLTTITTYLETVSDSSLKDIRLCLFDEDSVNTFKNTFIEMNSA